MNPLAANRTAAHPLPAPQGPARRCFHVEDLNWPAIWPTPGKKAPRPTGLWMPGPDGRWEDVTPTLQ